MQPETKVNPTQEVIRPFQLANYLGLKAFTAKTRDALVFVILNDTINIIRYDRALLWNFEDGDPVLLGISGEIKINKNARILTKWKETVKQIEEPTRAQILNFTTQGNNGETSATMLWLPIFSQDKHVLGLWLELWELPENSAPPQDIVNLLMSFLMPSYGAAWGRFAKKKIVKGFSLKKLGYFSLCCALVSALFLIKVPIRIVSPCEVVAKDPLIVAAPLEGVIDKIAARPGMHVTEGDLLFEYEKTTSLQELEVAKKEVEILQSEVKRAVTLGLDDPKSRRDIAILKLKLKKEFSNLDLAKHTAEKLEVKAERAGTVLLDSPDDWKGRPVKVGERILAISDPKKSKIRIWIPENDNIDLLIDKPIKIFLNVNPSKSYQANLRFISSESRVSEKQVPSFVGEADWSTPDEEIKLGLKGTAVLYGEKVSLIYFVLRRPFASFRNIFGV